LAAKIENKKEEGLLPELKHKGDDKSYKHE